MVLVLNVEKLKYISKTHVNYMLTDRVEACTTFIIIFAFLNIISMHITYLKKMILLSKVLHTLEILFVFVQYSRPFIILRIFDTQESQLFCVSFVPKFAIKTKFCKLKSKNIYFIHVFESNNFRRHLNFSLAK